MKAEAAARVLGLVFFLAMSWPVLRVPDGPFELHGFPSLLVYLFAGWAVLVLALALLSRRLGD